MSSWIDAVVLFNDNDTNIYSLYIYIGIHIPRKNPTGCYKFLSRTTIQSVSGCMRHISSDRASPLRQTAFFRPFLSFSEIFLSKISIYRFLLLRMLRILLFIQIVFFNIRTRLSFLGTSLLYTLVHFKIFFR